MRLKVATFYRRFGVRRREQIDRPRLFGMEHFTIPFPAILHFHPSDTVTLGPRIEDPLISGYDQRVFVEHVIELTHFEGNPRRTAINPTLLANDFRRKSRGFKPFHRDDALTINARNGLVINYGMLTPTYRYLNSYKRTYYDWTNRQHTQWAKVNELHDRFGWDQFIAIDLPQVIPTLRTLSLLNSALTEESLKHFSERDALTLFDLWKWIGEDRANSCMGVLSDDAVKMTNLVFRVKGYFFVMNLGVLDSFRKGEDDRSGLDPKMLQMRLRDLYQTLSDIQDGITDMEVDDTANEDERALAREEGIELLPVDPIMRLPAAPPLPEAPEPLVIDVDETAVTPTASLPKVDVTRQYSERLVKQAEGMNEVGLLTSKAKERATKDALKFTELNDPFGSKQSIAQAMATTQADYALEESRPLPDRLTVPDKSMLQSKIKDFHRKYTQELLPKHVMQTVMSVQNLGLIVNDYKIETVRDAMNHYQVHTVVVKPIKGRQSTLRFRLPVIDKDGRFISNGKANRMRLQRADQKST